MKSFGPFRLDTVNQCLWRAEARMPLTPKAFDVLRYLVERADRLVTQEEILEALWSETYVNPEGIRKYILEIRKVLGDQRRPPLFIETLPKRGYRFIAEVGNQQTFTPSAPASKAAGNLVGRDAALAELSEHLEKALNGHRQVIFVTGEAGIGKTTLIDAFQQQAARHPNLRVARGQCIQGFGAKEAYYPMLEALSAMLQNAANGSLIQTLAKQAPTWLAQFPSLVKQEQRDWLEREILGSTQGRMVRELCEALEAMTAQVPLIVILEDLHWADTSSFDLISAFARRREAAKVLLIGTYRPVDVVLSGSPLKPLKQDLQLRQLCHEMTVERLEEFDVAEYLAKEFVDNNFPSGLADLIYQNSGGNALFMVTIVREIVERGLIAQDRGKWTLTASLRDIYPGIPETLQQMLEIQFEQLSVAEQHILESGSVAGERFSVWAMAGMLDDSPTAIEDTCEKLARQQQFIRFAGIRGAANGNTSAHYEFRHSLYRQALYHRLSSVNRSKLHRGLGEQLVSACTGGSPELPSEVAMHFEEARDYERAARFFMLAAENAARRFSYRDSIQILRHALELTSSVAGTARTELEIEILQRIGDAHYALGAMSDSVLVYETAATQAAEAGLRTAQIGALARLAVPAWYLSPARGNQICEQAVEVSRDHGDPLLLARTQLAAARFRLLYDAWGKEDAEACASAHQTIRGLGGLGVPEVVYYAYIQAIQGDYKEALRQAEAGMVATTSPATHLLALGVKTLSLISSGRFGEALRIVRTGRDFSEKNGDDPWLFIFRETWLRALCFDFEGVLRLSKVIMRSDAEQHAAEPRAIAMAASGYAEFYKGNYKAALQCFDQVRDLRTTPKFFLHWHWRLHAELGATEAFLHAGDVANARRQADAFLQRALSTAEPNMQAHAWDVKARAGNAEKDFDSATECIHNALAILGQFEIPLAGWQVHRTAWDLYAALGDREKADRHRARAQELILRIADSFESGEPLRESFLAAPPVRRIFAQHTLA